MVVTTVGCKDFEYLSSGKISYQSCVCACTMYEIEVMSSYKVWSYDNSTYVVCVYLVAVKAAV